MAKRKIGLAASLYMYELLRAKMRLTCLKYISYTAKSIFTACVSAND